MSEHQADETSAETGSPGAAATTSSQPESGPASAAAPEITVMDSPRIAPDHEATKADAIKAEAPKVDTPNAEQPSKAEPTKAEPVKAAKADAPRTPHLMIMALGDRIHGEAPGAEKVRSDSPAAGNRRFAAMAAVVALAMVAGAVGGAFATFGVTHLAGTGAGTANTGLEASIARIDADIVALKGGVEQASKANLSQFTRTADRLDKLEKAQIDPAAKLAKLTEAVDKLRAAPQAPVAAAPATTAAKDITGSLPQQVATAVPGAVPLPVPKPEVSRMPAVEGWVLSDVGYGGALIENRRGSYEVYVGDSVPGLGRIDAIRRQDGRWVVVTSKGLITSR